MSITKETIEAWYLAGDERSQQLDDLIFKEARGLQEDIPGDIVADALLAAIAWRESGFGKHGGYPRVEQAYRPGGKLYRLHMPALYNLYGDAAASSWSSFQIMFPTAAELGYRGEPWDLWDDTVAIYWVKKFLVRAADRGAKTVEEFADAYNSGSHKDRFKPHEYMADIKARYSQMWDRRINGEKLGP